MTKLNFNNTDLEQAYYYKRRSFGVGYTIKTKREALLWATTDGGDGNHYIWAGTLPKIVPAGSTPTTTGGVVVGAWQNVGDGSLKSKLQSSSGAKEIGITSGNSQITNVQSLHDNTQGQFAKSLLKEGGVNDKTTDNTALVQTIINNLTSGYVVIEYGCKWNFANIIRKDEVQILDYSGYNPVSNQWGAQFNMFMQTSTPWTKNAHEFTISADHHPAFVINNDGTSTSAQAAYRASIVFRLAGVSIWRMGMGISNTDTHLVFASKGINGGNGNPTYPGRLYISSTSDSFGFNSALIDGVSYSFGNRTWTGDIITRFSARDNKGTILQFYTGTVTPVQAQAISYNSDGSITYNQNGANTLFIGVNGEVYGNRISLLDRTTSVNLANSNSNRLITNTGATGAVTYTLPSAIRGISFDIAVSEAFNITLRTTSPDIIRGTTNNRADSNAPGSMIKLVCFATGIWDISNKTGTWSI